MIAVSFTPLIVFAFYGCAQEPHHSSVIGSNTTSPSAVRPTDGVPTWTTTTVPASTGNDSTIKASNKVPPVKASGEKESTYKALADKPLPRSTPTTPSPTVTVTTVKTSTLTPSTVRAPVATTVVVPSTTPTVRGPSVTTTTVKTSTVTPSTVRAPVASTVVEPAPARTLAPEPALVFPTSRYMNIGRVIEVIPEAAHRGTIIFLHGVSGIAADQLELVRNKGLFEGLASHVKVVAPQVASTGRNPNRAWFPFLVDPWDMHDRSLGEAASLNESLNTLQMLVDREARLLGGDYSRIYLVGYSQGGMMAMWQGLMANKSFGGVVSLLGAFPLTEIENVSDKGQNVAIYHPHDRRDLGVLFNYAERGFRAARRAGARGYAEITNIEISGNTHHGLSQNLITQANSWLKTAMRGTVIARS